MKPKYLHLFAIGPFGGHEEIDFQKFGMKGLVLFSGETGAGKTFIFDAITYALYGRANGDRNENSLQSDFSDRTERPFIEMVFEHNGKEYTIKRWPACRLARKRSGGSGEDVPKSADVEFTEPGKAPMTKIKEVNARIEEILGIGFKQWGNISMIAQGEFRKLVSVKSNERSEILSTIFSTESVKRFQRDIKDRYDSVNREIDSKKTIAENSMRNIEIGDDYKDYADRIEFKCEYIAEIIELLTCQMKDDKDRVEEGKRLFEELVQAEADLGTSITNADKTNRDIANLGECKKKLALLREKEPSVAQIKKDNETWDKVIVDVAPLMANISSKTKELEKYKADVADLESKIQTGTLNVDELAKKVAIAQKETEKVSAIDEKIGALTNQLPQYEEIENLKSTINSKKAERDTLIVALNGYEERRTELNEKITGYREYLSKNSNIAGDLERTKGIITDFDTKSILLKKIKSKIAQHEKYSTGLIDEQFRLKNLTSEKDECLKKYNQAFNKYISQQAGIMAKDLKGGCPCPVCGSNEHPHPASISGEMVEKSDVDELSLLLKQKEEQVSELSATISSIRSTISESEKSILEDFDTLTGSAPRDFEDVKERIGAIEFKMNEELTYAKSQLEDFTRIHNTFISMSDELNTKLDGEMADINTKISELTVAVTALGTEIDGNETQLNNRATNLEFESKDVLNAKIEELRSSAKKIRDDYEEINVLFIDNQNAVSNDKTKRGEKITQIDGCKASIEGFEAELDRRLAELNITYEKAEQMISDRETLQKRKDVVEMFEDELKAMVVRIEELKKNIEGKTVVNVEELVAKRTEVTNRRSEIDVKLNALKDRISKNTTVIGNLTEFQKDNAESMRELEIIQPLFEVSNGKNPMKMTFETYVQKIYFELVLQYANERLYGMTSGRYVLKSKVETSGGAIAGLDIDVLDNFTGRMRSSETLSGGESFMAALSLALGLSDVVQEMSGGIRIETLFVDEGFGSLDPSALAKSIEVLNKLGGGERLVGVISHVEALEESIEKKVKVTKKSCGGSKVTMEY